MKQILFVLTILISGILHATPTEYEKIEQNFKKAFPEAQNVTWIENENSYQVFFVDNQIKCRMWFDRNGVVKSTERYYTEEGLNPFVLSKVKHKFSKQKVFGVTEVNTEEGVFYFIVLEDEKNWYHITSDASGNLNFSKKYNKA